MNFPKALLQLAAVIAGTTTRVGAQRYNLVDHYDASNWLNMFSVQSIPDPTGGFVSYVTQSEAQALGLLKIQGNQVSFGVDNTNVISPSGPGRNSVRLMSNKAYNNGLIIGDFAHMKVYLARKRLWDLASLDQSANRFVFSWVVGPNWPSSGEIDIIEGVNIGVQDQMTLHTSPGCTVTVGTPGQTGTSVGDPLCGDGGGYNGCAVVDYVGTSYGTAFNSVGGGVYATLWTNSAIQIWYWARNNIPADVANGTPDPSGWGTPAADFAGCAFDTYFKNMQIIFDTTFCGAWAGAVWPQSYCGTVDSSCVDYVAKNPQAFADGYWLVNSVKVYQT
ncbi:hypothetical protein MMC30_003343 [Trapelia coarctata]|nr:hypothetical protein [Trapelia coarctata]